MVHPRHWKNFSGLPHISVVSYFFWEMDIIKMSICSSFIVVLLHITSRMKRRWRIQMPTTIVKPSFYLFPTHRLIFKCFHEFTKMRGVSLLIVNFFFTNYGIRSEVEKAINHMVDIVVNRSQLNVYSLLTYLRKSKRVSRI